MTGKVRVEYSKGVLNPDWATSWKEKALGLRGKRSGCMMFDLGKDSRPVFDMIGVRSALQMVFISDGLKVQEVVHARPGFNFYSPEEPCRYVLEDFSFPSIEEGEQLRFRQ